MAHKLSNQTTVNQADFASNAFLGFDPDWLLGPLRDHHPEERLRVLIAEGAAWSEEQGLEEALSVC